MTQPNPPNPADLGRDLASLFDELAGSRSDALASLQDLVVARQSLLELEALRLERKLGTGSPRVEELQWRVIQNRTLTKNVAQEVEASSIVPVQAAPEEAVVEGRLVDESQRGLEGLVVRLEDRAGNPLSAVGPVTSGQGGYYALRLSPDVAKQLGASAQGGVFLAVRTPDGQLVQRTPQALPLEAGARINLSAAFTRADLAGRPVRPDEPPRPRPSGPTGGGTPPGPAGPAAPHAPPDVG